MPLQLKFTASKNTTDILLPFAKDMVRNDLISSFTGLDYDIHFGGTAKEYLSLMHAEKFRKIHLLGLGETKDLTKSYCFFRSFIFQQRSKHDLAIEVITEHLNDAQLKNAVIGLRLGLVNHGTFKTNGNKYTEPEITVLLPKEKKTMAEQALAEAETMVSVMQLVDHPSNYKTPEYIGRHTVESGKKYGYSVKVIEAKELKKMGMDALLAVGQGSNNPPVLIIMEYNGIGKKSKTPKLGLVGKGVSFDTGGISIKPSANMGYMKSDMAGAAAVIGAIELAAKLQLKIHVAGIIPSAENSVDAASLRPGDVIGSYSGKSIEVIDTDAEGRLVLADGLAYIIKNFHPEYMVDLATLTGSCIAALGYCAAGLFSQNDDLSLAITRAGEEVNERVWRFPLWEDYLSDMQSDIADIKNLSGKPVAGAITAAKFLEYFTSEHTKWAHLDIAGVAFSDSEYAKSRTSTAYGVRLLINLMKELA